MNCWMTRLSSNHRASVLIQRSPCSSLIDRNFSDVWSQTESTAAAPVWPQLEDAPHHPAVRPHRRSVDHPSVIARHEGDHPADFLWGLEPLEERVGPSPREEVL